MRCGVVTAFNERYGDSKSCSFLTTKKENEDKITNSIFCLQ